MIKKKKYSEIEGDLIYLFQKNNFDAIVHGANCFNMMGAGIALQIASTFKNAQKADNRTMIGDVRKLGNYTWAKYKYGYVINAYTQYLGGANLDYEALTLVLRKINHKFKGEHIGLPQIGCGIAGGDWKKVRKIIKRELKNCYVTVVIYKQ